MLVDRPQASDDMVKTIADSTYTFLRPNWSDILPASGMAMICPSW